MKDAEPEGPCNFLHVRRMETLRKAPPQIPTIDGCPAHSSVPFLPPCLPHQPLAVSPTGHALWGPLPAGHTPSRRALRVLREEARGLAGQQGCVPWVLWAGVYSPHTHHSRLFFFFFFLALLVACGSPRASEGT